MFRKVLSLPQAPKFTRRYLAVDGSKVAICVRKDVRQAIQQLRNTTTANNLADQCKIATYVWQDASSRSKRKGKE
jgi:hypothetical protein